MAAPRSKGRRSAAAVAVAVGTCSAALTVVLHIFRALYQRHRRLQLDVCEQQITVTPLGVRQSFVAMLLPFKSETCEQILAAMPEMKQSHVVGLDVEWQPERKANQRHPVALIQIAFADRCILHHVLHSDGVPPSIVALLEDPSIMKVGFGIKQDIQRLARDYGLTTHSALEIPDLISHLHPNMQTPCSGLRSASAAILGLQIDKTQQCSNWAAEELSPEQIQYAALDPWLSRAIALQLIHQHETGSSSNSSSNSEGCCCCCQEAVQKGDTIDITTCTSSSSSNRLTETSSGCAAAAAAHKDAKNAGPACSCSCSSSSGARQASASQDPSPPSLGDLGNEVHHILLAQHARHSAFPLRPQLLEHQQQRLERDNQQQQQQVQDGRQRLGSGRASPLVAAASPLEDVALQTARNRPIKAARLPTRQTIQYENCRILAPDGTTLCTCGSKKINWYLSKGLAVLEEEEPMTIRLKFEPRGRGHADDAYYLSDKENRCCVCGHDGEYLRHSVVPHVYRQHFPPQMKSHLSHDIVLMCVGCHQRCNLVDTWRMQVRGGGRGSVCLT